MKPILFNTEMVRAILDGRKTVTRRVITPPPDITPIQTFGGNYRISMESNLFVKPPYRPGDILYVREAFSECKEGYAYRADNQHSEGWGWRPSIHMPREAARIFLRVKTVQVDRLQDITAEQAADEGQKECCGFTMCGGAYGCNLCEAFSENSIKWFEKVWNSTIKPADRALYGWEANPWVWVIKFERISMEDAENEKV